MITLEKEFTSGDGGFSGPDILTYKQVTRSEKAAVYQRSRGTYIKDFETIAIRVDPKGKVQKFPGGIVKVIEEDREMYPSTGQWGKMGWSFKNKGAALEKFERLNSEILTEDAPEEAFAMTIPIGEFSTKDLANSNGIEYPIAALWIKTSLETGVIKFLKEERRNVKGKPSKIFIKA